jgi:vacuolar protein sorting-associated protein 13A/C
VILNKTGLDISIKSKSLLGQAKNAAGQGVLADSGGDSENRKALPYMFSFPSDERQNRAILKVGDSNWSKPQSLDAIGSNAEVVLPSATKQTEIHIGITIQEGEGKV